jgi:hypothetical protein
LKSSYSFSTFSSFLVWGGGFTGATVAGDAWRPYPYCVHQMSQVCVCVQVVCRAWFRNMWSLKLQTPMHLTNKVINVVRDQTLVAICSLSKPIYIELCCVKRGPRLAAPALGEPCLFLEGLHSSGGSRREGKKFLTRAFFCP